MVSAIQSNNVDIVEQLLDKGVNIKTFLTIERLLELYESSLGSPLTDLLRNMRKKNKKTSPKKISMEQVGQVIKYLLDEYYLQQYSSNPDVTYLPETFMFENPFLHLMIWAVLNNLQDMAKLFWRKGLDSIAAALLAQALFSAMAKELENASPNMYAGIEANRREFKDLATGVLDRCYKTNENDTVLLLILNLEQWEAENCISVAIKTNNKTFITATACHEVLNTMWMGKMTKENGFLKLLICTFIPPLIPLCVQFKEDKNIEQYPDDDTDDEEAAGVSSLLQQSHSMNMDWGQDEMMCAAGGCPPSPSNYRAVLDVMKDSTIPKKKISKSYEVSDDQTLYMAGLSSPSQRKPKQSHKTKHGDELKYFSRAKRNIPLFYGAPVVHFLSHVISYMAFLCLYSYVLISKFHQNLSVEDVILIVWVFTIFIDEICQVIATRRAYTEINFKAYLADFWNIADILMILLFVVGMILKHLSYQETLESARVVLSINLIIYFIRLLPMLSLNKELGPKLVMIIRMVRNLTSFFVMLLIFIVAYAIASHAILYPNTEISFNLLWVIFRRPYWNIYGDLMLDEIEGTNDCTNIVELYRNGTQLRCPTESGKYVVPVLTGVYMLMCNILLLNLLISIFSFTYQKVQDKANKHWRVQRYLQMQDYLARKMHIPFISFIKDIVQIIVFLKEYLRQSKPENRTSRKDIFLKDFPEDYRKTLREWEKTIVQDFINSKKADLESIDNNVTKIAQRLDQLFSKIDALEKQQHTLTATIENARLHPSQTDCVAKSESSTVGSVTLD